MTTRLLNATRLVAIAGIGVESRDAVVGAASNPRIPSPSGGTLRWYVDAAATAT